MFFWLTIMDYDFLGDDNGLCFSGCRFIKVILYSYLILKKMNERIIDN